MNKIKTSVCALLLGCLGLSVSSCGGTDPNLMNALVIGGASVLGQKLGADATKMALIKAGSSVLTGVIAAKQGAQKGTPQQFAGSYSAQLLTYDAKSKGYLEAGKPVTVSATTTLYVQNGQIGSVSFPAVQANNASMAQVTLTNLVVENNIYKLGDNSTATEGKLTCNGQTYELENAYVELGFGDATSLKYTASIYFNYNEELKQYMYAMNLTFTK